MTLGALQNYVAADAAACDDLPSKSHNFAHELVQVLPSRPVIVDCHALPMLAVYRRVGDDGGPFVLVPGGNGSRRC